ncbi:hypothetical protein E3T35_07620 [Cryobacterium sp. TMT1-2-2]|nr:hypothetical protein E3T35_07620 [Cryobacterium sp. TMT1-2-2]
MHTKDVADRCIRSSISQLASEFSEEHSPAFHAARRHEKLRNFRARREQQIHWAAAREHHRRLRRHDRARPEDGVAANTFAGDGTFRVGTDIQPGTYPSDGGSSC